MGYARLKDTGRVVRDIDLTLGFQNHGVHMGAYFGSNFLLIFDEIYCNPEIRNPTGSF